MPSRALISAVFVAVAMLLVPVAAEAKRSVPERFYGVMWDRATVGAPDAAQEGQWALMARSGVETARTVFPWWRMQPHAGQAPDFSGTDRMVAFATAHNVRLLPVVQYTPAWAAIDPSNYASPPRDPSDYVNFIEALMMRYGPEGSFWQERPDLPRRPLREWQIWNEPHLQNYWDTGARGDNAWAEEYATLLKAASRKIRELDPDATIVLAGLADFAWQHLDRLARFGIRRYFDVASINFFTSRADRVLKGVRYFRTALRRAHMARRPIWLTEVTWPAGKGRVPTPGPLWQRQWWTTDAGMASRLRSIYSLAARESRRLRLWRVYWYTWSSAYESGDLFDYTGLNRYRGDSYESMPALKAYVASARRHQGCRKLSSGVCARR